MQETIDLTPTWTGIAPKMARPTDACIKRTNALKVIVLDPKISQWLQANDPKALEQAREALS
jgi:hypothetical protein